ncbi:MAG TPA: phosphoenolpyruvate synthase [bacterium]|nr:phosphoenolpyruvate synthase [bacterium]
MRKKQALILFLNQISKEDVPLVGGKNASLGEMYSKLSRKGINVPFGFCLTSKAYFYYLKANGIDKKLKELFKDLNISDIKKLKQIGKEARNLILKADFPKDLEKKILKSYQKLNQFYQTKDLEVAVRSSATAEDLPSASFAGQHETYLNVKGEKELLLAIKKCFASLFNDRAIVYREEKGFSHFKVGLSVGVQKMVRSDLASSGVMFTLDTETGFDKVVLINSIFGVGEMIVKGRVVPDTFYVFKETLKENFRPIIVKNLGRKTRKYVFKKEGGLKEVKVPLKDQKRFSLEDDEVLTLAKWAMEIEKHYGRAQDIEWAKDGKEGKLYIVQSRPETVHSLKKRSFIYREYQIKTKKAPILTGIAVGDKIGEGRVHVIKDVSKISEFKKGEVLVTRMTDPDWVSIFPLASAIITQEGGPTCHAAIVSRELGIPCIVGVKDVLKVLKTGDYVTVDCTQGREGRIFLGKVDYKVKEYDLKKIPKLRTKIMLNVGVPETSFRLSFLPNDGVGLAREEFIIAQKIKIHPLALYHFRKLKNKKLKKKIEALTFGYKDKRKFYIDKLAEGIAQIAAAFYPKKVIVRFSDFKTNEYRNLIGGELFEEKEENPMIGWRGAARYYDEKFRPAFEMEIEAIKKVRDVFGLKNVAVMVPFCRTPEEGRKVLKILEEKGLKQGKDGLEVYVMCEIPSNVILVEKFLDIFDGMSIGSNDLTQLTLGIDRDNAKIAHIGNEKNEAVKEEIKKVIEVCRRRKKYLGICGDAPSSFPDFAQFLFDLKIPSMSLSPDAVLKIIATLISSSA